MAARTSGAGAIPEPAASTVFDYLRERARPSALVVLLLLAIGYPFAAGAQQAPVFVTLCVLAACLALRAPRWVAVGVLLLGLFLLISDYVFTIAVGSQDRQSERDEAVESAAEALLAGTNPWANPTPLGAPITTGPSSVLVALPAVLVSHRINTVSFAFYALFLAVLLSADLHLRNGTFLPLGLFFMSGFLGFQHALYWSLDELAWAYLALVAAWRLRASGWSMAAGACLAFALGSRSSYAFPVFAFLCWAWFRPERRGNLPRLAAGAAIGTALILAPFAVVVGSDLAVHNPFTAAGNMLASAWPDTNPIFRFLNATVGALGPRSAALTKAALGLAAIWYASMRARGGAVDHPFWHMTFAALLASCLVYPAQVYEDYALFFAVPAFLAVAHSRSGFGRLTRDRPPESSPVRGRPPRSRR